MFYCLNAWGHTLPIANELRGVSSSVGNDKGEESVKQFQHELKQFARNVFRGLDVGHPPVPDQYRASFRRLG